MHLVVRNARLADPHVWDDPATMAIYDSVVDHVAAYRGGRIYLENCQVRHDLEVKERGAMICAHVLVSSPYSPIGIIELDGGRFAELDAPGILW